MKEFPTSNVNYNIQQPASQADFFNLQEEIFPSISQSEEIPVYTPTRNLKSYSVLPYDGRQIRLGIKDISSNGTYQALEDSVDGYSKVFVNVQPILQNKTTTPSKSTQVISFDSGYQGLENVTINPIPEDYIIPQGSRTATYNANLTYTEDVKSIQTLNVSVNVVPNLQSKTISPSSSSQVIESDYGYQGLSSVTVNAIPDTYIQPSGNKNINITQNGITTQDVFSYSGARIVTAVPASAVDSGTKQTSITTNSTSTIDVIGYANHQIQVNVPNTYAAADQGKVVENGVLVEQTSRSITTNSTVDTTKNNQVVVNVPNTYVASDQGKVVSGGELVTPGSTTYTANSTYDTTLINNVNINVPGFSIDEIATRDFQNINNLTLSSSFIYPYSFFNNSSITSVSAPNVTSFKTTKDRSGSYVFAYCTNLTDIYFPNLTDTGNGGYQFAGCTSLINVYMPKTITGQHMFDGCTALPHFVSISTGQMNSYGFQNCTSLTALDLATSRIYTGQFSGATSLSTIILRRSSSPVTLSNINAFNNTPFKSGGSGGTIYIPQVLYNTLGTGTNDYQAASNWSTIYGYGTITWKKIEGSIYENKYVDGTPIENNSQ